MTWAGLVPSELRDLLSPGFASLIRFSLNVRNGTVASWLDREGWGLGGTVSDQDVWFCTWLKEPCPCLSLCFLHRRENVTNYLRPLQSFRVVVVVGQYLKALLFFSTSFEMKIKYYDCSCFCLRRRMYEIDVQITNMYSTNSKHLKYFHPPVSTF